MMEGQAALIGGMSMRQKEVEISKVRLKRKLPTEGEEAFVTTRLSPFRRMGVFIGLIADLRQHDLLSALAWMKKMYPEKALPVRLFRFLTWAFDTMWRKIPEALEHAKIEEPISKTPVWLIEGNLYENYPWKQNPTAALPEQVEVAVIGAGFIGAAAAYHWSKNGTSSLVILEMNDPASGAGGRNAGVVTMGRYYHFVFGTVKKYLDHARRDLTQEERVGSAHEFASVYVKAAYANAEMIEQTIKEEGIECDYVRKGWVWITDGRDPGKPEMAHRMGQAAGFSDFVRISSQEAFEKCGLKTTYDAGYSIGASTWHPAKWIWGLFRVALTCSHVQLFCRTKVLQVNDAGEFYEILTERGMIRARYVVNATESHSPTLFENFHNIIQPMQTQLALGCSDGGTMKPGVAISTPEMFFTRTNKGVLLGSDESRVSDDEANKNQPSRFITKYVLSHVREYFAIQSIKITNEWSGTMGMTPDEFPVIGLMDGKRLYIVGGLAGSGSGVSFLGARHVIHKILGKEDIDYYPEKYFSHMRFNKNRS